VSQWRLNPQARPIVTRLTEIVCPPDGRGRVQGVLAEFERMVGGLPAGSRRGLVAAFLAFDRGARLYPRARGRRFVLLDDDVADAYLSAVAARPGPAGNAARKLKSLIAMCYYELAEVKEELGYRPGPYIAAVSRRRLESYGAEIAAGEALVLAPDPPGAEVLGAEVPGAEVPGAEVPGAEVPGAEVPGAEAP
jgi:hypothetical protein